jgi:hypothetical protein
MANDAILAAGWTFTVDNTPIGGINSFTLGESDNKADITVFTNIATNGRKRHIKTSIEQTVTCEGLFLEDDGPSTGRDAGQAAVELLAHTVGLAAEGVLGMTSPGGTTKARTGTFKLSDIGGGNEDPTKWGFEFTQIGIEA